MPANPELFASGETFRETFLKSCSLPAVSAGFPENKVKSRAKARFDWQTRGLVKESHQNPLAVDGRRVVVPA